MADRLTRGDVTGAVPRDRTAGQIRPLFLIPAALADDNPSMAVVDSVHARLADLTAGMMGEVCGRPAPRAHLSFLALGGGDVEASELADTVNAIFGLDLTGEAVVRSPTPDALARTIADGWFHGGGSAPDLVELIEALADAG
jgi:hypothetical protein